MRVAAHDAGGRRAAGHEVGERFERRARGRRRQRRPRTDSAVEREGAALVAVVEDEQLGHPEFAADLDLVSAGGVRQRVGELERLVHASQRLRAAHGRESADGDVGRPAQIGIGDAGVEAHRDRIGGVILRIERLLEIVVPDDQLVDEVRGEDAGRHHRDVVHPARHRLVVREVRRAGLRHLIAAAAEIARRHVEDGVELVIDFCNAVVAAVRVRIGADEVLRDGRSRAALRGPQRQQVSRRRVDGHTKLIQELRRARHPVSGRRGRRRRVAGGQLLDFERREEERLVVHDRAAEREAVLVVANRTLRRAGRRHGRGRRQLLVAIEVEGAPVKVVGA